MLLLLHCKTRYVEYVSVAHLSDNTHADMMQTSLDCGQLPSDYRADLWTFTNVMIIRKIPMNV